MALENLADLEAAWAEWMKPLNSSGKRTQGATWRRDNPSEWSQLSAYREGTAPRPTLASITGRQMVFETDAWFKARDETPPPPPVNDFGSALPDRLAESQGDGGVVVISPNGSDTAGNGTEGSPYRSPHKAFSVVNLTGGLIYARGGTYNLAGTGVGGTGQQQFNRVGSLVNPPQFRAYPGEVPIFTKSMFLVGPSTTTQGLRVGPGLKFRDAINTGWDLLRVERANGHVEIVGNEFGPTIHTGGANGILVSDTLDFNITQVQVWDCFFHHCGAGGHYHGLYFAEADDTCLVANCVFYDNAAFHAQFGPASRNLIVTCCTTYGHQTGGYGSLAYWDEPAQNVLNWGVRSFGCIVAATTNYPGYSWSGRSNPTPPHELRDCIAWNTTQGAVEPGSNMIVSNMGTGNPNFVNAAMRDLRIGSGSAAIDHVTQTYEGFIPATDILGNQRITRDAGAYAKEAAL